MNNKCAVFLYSQEAKVAINATEGVADVQPRYLQALRHVRLNRKQQRNARLPVSFAHQAASARLFFSSVTFLRAAKCQQCANGVLIVGNHAACGRVAEHFNRGECAFLYVFLSGPFVQQILSALGSAMWALTCVSPVP